MDNFDKYIVAVFVQATHMRLLCFLYHQVYLMWYSLKLFLYTVQKSVCQNWIVAKLRS